MSNFQSMIDGYRRFRNDDWVEAKERWSELSSGQKPGVLVVGCSDSRIDPATIFDTAPGETFVVRNIAALIPPCEDGGGRHGVSAALEYAVTQLKVGEIVVMGHASCGGVAASRTRCFAEAGRGEGGFVSDWVDILDETRDRVEAEHGSGDDAQRVLEHESVKTSIANLRTFPFVKKAEDEGSLKLIGAWFSIAEGRLHVLKPEKGQFEVVEAD